MQFRGENSIPETWEMQFWGQKTIPGGCGKQFQVVKPILKVAESNFGLRNLSPKLWNAGAKCETIPQK
jgi:hypothetical protein